VHASLDQTRYLHSDWVQSSPDPLEFRARLFIDNFWFKHHQKTSQDMKVDFDEIGLFSEIKLKNRLICENKSALA